uniref:SHSP domain-containing protein n=1 Tax=Acrobeloides nanus TaxID=290746 RepID=A0A914DFP9_9BILA
MPPNATNFVREWKGRETSSESFKQRKPNPVNYSTRVFQIDSELAQIRTKPSKIINDKKKYIVIIDMSNFRPEDIEVILEKGHLTVQAEQEVALKENTVALKRFVRKFTIPEDVRTEMVATELDRRGMLTITALRNSTN